MTLFATVLAATSGRSVAGCVVVAAAVLSGQLSVGWLNDLLDAERDRTAARQDKPLARGVLRPAVVRTACGVAVIVCVPLSLASGGTAGLAHLVAVAGGWAYDLGVKGTRLSFLPYAVSFGLLVSFVVLGLPGSPTPPVWLVAAAALLGCGAHFLNVVPDVEDDLAAGVRGLPQRLGAVTSAAVGAVLLASAVVVLTLGPGSPPWWAWVGLGIAVAAAGAAGILGARSSRRRSSRRTPFLLAVVTAAVAIALLVARAPHLG